MSDEQSYHDPESPAPWRWEYGELVAADNRTALGAVGYYGDDIHLEASPYVRELIRMAPELADLLRQFGGDHLAACPLCRHSNGTNDPCHAPECRFAQLLAALHAGGDAVSTRGTPESPAPWRWERGALIAADGSTALVATGIAEYVRLEASPYVRELIRMAPELADLLRQFGGDHLAACPLCRQGMGTVGSLHTPGCRLAEVLAALAAMDTTRKTEMTRKTEYPRLTLRLALARRRREP